ncbi:YqzE family protein [Paenibacillus sp. S150]|uniref:YqzE family protein n=1 Tax=Paenibacillus sp. S150 TaxID=2749826 RepID=UPI001C592CEF|nr:YqzE family protein [Paenibacillus sp. S150]MBW4082603.1 YqzE family protein [Paenibacillus sp. S150]
MASGGDDLVKYITEKVVVYIEDPKGSRERRKSEKQPWAEKWFGMLPLGWSMWRSKWARRSKKIKQLPDGFEE